LQGILTASILKDVAEPSLDFSYEKCNFGRIHQKLRVTPAMEAGISDHVWSIEEIIALL
jgi:hypothetical protein